MHQEATQIPSAFLSATNGKIYAPTNTTTAYSAKKYDSISQYPNGKTAVFATGSYETETYSEYIGLVSPRPTNVAVLFCIKYE